MNALLLLDWPAMGMMTLVVVGAFILAVLLIWLFEQGNSPKA